MANCVVHSIFTNGENYTCYEIGNDSRVWTLLFHWIAAVNWVQVSRVLHDWPSREEQMKADAYSHFEE